MDHYGLDLPSRRRVNFDEDEEYDGDDGNPRLKTVTIHRDMAAEDVGVGRGKS